MYDVRLGLVSSPRIALVMCTIRLLHILIIISLVWIISTAYAMPRYIISHTITNPLSGSFEVICIMSRIRYNSKVFDITNFILLYLLPLAVMTVLYSLIAVRLWNSGLNYSSTYVSTVRLLFSRLKFRYGAVVSLHSKTPRRRDCTHSKS
ncbi:hypothetical protein RUM43_009190 [Polyplax serrata]|uniref:Thyrotropin-releasing hormone receptor n=1 Tax=Polyplax serrata TaxID=468196 RepID=A0AAN8PAF4_POLSC